MGRVGALEIWTKRRTDYNEIVSRQRGGARALYFLRSAVQFKTTVIGCAS
jgi:hypothetical protein